MNLIENIRRLFTTEPTVETLEAAQADLERALGTAKAHAASAWAQHNARAIEFIGSTDDAPAKRSRATCEDGDRRVADLELALKDTLTRLEAARTARSASDVAAAWQACSSHLRARGEAMAALQAMLVGVAEKHREVLALTEAAWQSLPVHPQSRPPTYAASDLSTRMQVFLAGASQGRLGMTGIDAFVASQKPDLVSIDDEATKMLLSVRPEVARRAEDVTS